MSNHVTATTSPTSTYQTSLSDPDVAILAGLLAYYGVYVDRCDFDALRWSALLP